jgi:hypothetical protein
MGRSWQHTLSIENHLSVTSTKKSQQHTPQNGYYEKVLVVYISAHLPVMSLVNITRGAEPMGKVTLNVQIFESVLSKGTYIMCGCFQINPLNVMGNTIIERRSSSL